MFTFLIFSPLKFKLLQTDFSNLACQMECLMFVVAEVVLVISFKCIKLLYVIYFSMWSWSFLFFYTCSRTAMLLPKTNFDF